MTENPKQLTHLDSRGEVRMVDVSGKSAGVRQAVASGVVHCSPETVQIIVDQAAKKGDVLAVIRVAGIQGAKRTPDLIPLAHPIAIHSVEVDVDLGPEGIAIVARVKTADRTGIEMEALTAVSCAALTAIDMIKGIDRQAHIGRIWLEEKSGGRSGTWKRDDQPGI